MSRERKARQGIGDTIIPKIQYLRHMFQAKYKGRDGKPPRPFVICAGPALRLRLEPARQLRKATT